MAGATGREPTSNTTAGVGCVGHRVDQLADPVRDVLIHPVDDETVRREQAQRPSVLHGLQRPDPRIELLLRQFHFQLRETAAPQRTLHGFVP